MNTFLLLDTAIDQKVVIAFRYNGYSRQVEPHHYGLLNNKVQLHAYQVGGTSSTGRLGWKNFEIDKIEHLKLLHISFHARSDHNPPNSHYLRIDKIIK